MGRAQDDKAMNEPGWKYKKKTEIKRMKNTIILANTAQLQKVIDADNDEILICAGIEYETQQKVEFNR
jgi:hypothetical protein